MSFDITEFEQNITQYGVSSANKYDVDIALPVVLNNVIGNRDFSFVNQFQDIARFRCIASSTPGGAFLKNETRKWGVGPMIKQACNIAFPSLRLVFLLDETGIIEQTFTTWMNFSYNYGFDMNGASATFYTNYRNYCVSPNISVTKYDFYGNVINTYNVTQALPDLITTQPLEWDGVNQLNRLTVNFDYTSYTLRNFYGTKKFISNI